MHDQDKRHIPLPDRGRPARVFPKLQSRPNSVVIRVENMRGVPYYDEPLDRLVPEARPVPWDMDKVQALLDGKIERWAVDFRPRSSRMCKQFFRIVQMYVNGQYIKAQHRAAKLIRQACEEKREIDFLVWDILRCFHIGTLDADKDLGLWTKEEADFWSLGKWPGDGKAGEVYEQAVLKWLHENPDQAPKRQGTDQPATPGEV